MSIGAEVDVRPGGLASRSFHYLPPGDRIVGSCANRQWCGWVGHTEHGIGPPALRKNCQPGVAAPLPAGGPPGLGILAVARHPHPGYSRNGHAALDASAAGRRGARRRGLDGGLRGPSE